eukprot:TRINITY_DN4651_c0_g1_i1.p4 TRINITY_DN4651_c0_g1~~TRINITY_DN4651_c0_g1_i1.p4  ORF type:complete len:56 (-),score=6.69 TRINITY_DN4651_c0_g1_i1:10-177(-)
MLPTIGGDSTTSLAEITPTSTHDTTAPHTTAPIKSPNCNDVKEVKDENGKKTGKN